MAALYASHKVTEERTEPVLGVKYSVNLVQSPSATLERDRRESLRNQNVNGSLSKRDLHVTKIGSWSDQGTVRVEANVA